MNILKLYLYAKDVILVLSYKRIALWQRNTLVCSTRKKIFIESFANPETISNFAAQFVDITNKQNKEIKL